MTAFFTPQRLDWHWDPSSFLFSGFLEVRRTERGTDHSLASSAEVKNNCSYTTISLHGTYKEIYLETTIRSAERYIIIIIIKIFINCKWVDTRWQWSFHILHMHGL
jgi:hypothetical protein